MTIGKLCKCDVITASKNMSVQEAARLMKKHNIGDIIIVDEEKDGKPIGIFTDRDIAIKIIAEEADPQSITVGDAMSEELLVLKDYQHFQESLDMMCAKGVRRAPIVDQHDKIIGIAAVDDLILLLIDELGSLAKLIRRQISK